MYNHEPARYVCPICLGVQGIEDNRTLIRQSDIVFRNDTVMAFIASYFIGNNPGHLIVVPTTHYENFYDLPEDVGSKVFATARKMALALKEAYQCDGVMVMQNNEPASGQHAFHYHLHIFPRYTNDDIYAHMSNKRETNAQERLPYADKILQALASHK